jgi:hypothetical protein
MTIRRLKTYAGAQGFVYQYYFVGKRTAEIPAGMTVRNASTSNAYVDLKPGRIDEYIFDVTSDRQSTYAVTILLPEAVLKTWADAHGRPLSDAEQYAAAKMRLFRAFDGEKNLAQAGGRCSVDSEFLEEALAALGIN